MRVSVLGCGRWGSFHAWYANYIGHDVMIWGREGSHHFDVLKATRQNEYLTLPEEIVLTQNLQEVLNFADTIIISISSQQLRSFGRQLAALGGLKDKTFVLCMKGLEIGSGKRLSVVLHEEIGMDKHVAVWVGPGHVQDFIRGIPNCMVVSSNIPEQAKQIAEKFGSTLIRFYYEQDFLGVEIGAAAKNVIGLAAGMLDGMNYASLKGALMARGTNELSRLIVAMGGDAMTVYGLSHLGDYEATLFSQNSNNRRFGEDLIAGKPFMKLAEGVYTAEALMKLAAKYDIDLPICRVVYAIVSQHKNPKEQLVQLFLRPFKAERVQEDHTSFL